MTSLCTTYKWLLIIFRQNSRNSPASFLPLQPCLSLFPPRPQSLFHPYQNPHTYWGCRLSDFGTHHTTRLLPTLWKPLLLFSSAYSMLCVRPDKLQVADIPHPGFDGPATGPTCASPCHPKCPSLLNPISCWQDTKLRADICHVFSCTVMLQR